ncbi:hypothetical protein JOC85_003126 [Bacillus mesophilus]|uniref:PilN domain-containing protein n=1 Tax=Bacillus mesophilus TaxID=1808955 RepID=A0A6M0Q9K9_9BACI|nr:hypothetical protein [Bacillus mesophilus]MBM7662319.1 hypothetical protein [Bacillus mesophilus]NEY73051.1 hypothetical protein [Bacillus mesophilus]
MNVSIDLLPQSKSIRINRYPLILVAGIAVLGITIYSIFSYINVKSSIKSLEEAIVLETQYKDQLQTEYTNRITGITEYNFVDKYTKTNNLMSNIYKNPTELQDNVYKLLTTNAKVKTYTYDNNGNLLITANFPSKTDVAIFVNRLFFAEFVTDVEVNTILVDKEQELYESQFTITLVSLEGEQQ